MVEVGELTVKGTFEDEGLNNSLSRMDSKISDIENQFGQLNPSMKTSGLLINKISKGLLAIGVAGFTAMSVLAAKSPVLAGTFAKMEVNTMKLSNTLGRQLKPIFEALATDLLPSLNEFFIKNSQSVEAFANKTALLVNSVSSLIRMDWEGLGNNLDDLFRPKTENEELKKTGQAMGEFEESYIGINEMFDRQKRIEENPFLKEGLQKDVASSTAFIGDAFLNSIRGIIDMFQVNNDVKTNMIVSSNGVPR